MPARSFRRRSRSAAALGITITVASGDNGSTDGETGNNVDFPASSPHVLGCGGTALTASNGVRQSEVVWNDQASGGGASGGGVSAVFPLPGWQENAGVPEAGELLAAITKLAESLHPVTAETLRACREEAVDAIRSYKKITYWLAACIIPLSMISFIIAGISNSITAELKTANDLTVSLHLELNAPNSATQDQLAPSGAVAELQQFAAGMRAVYSRTRQLDWFVANSVRDQLACKAGPAGADKTATCSYAMMELDPDLNANSLIAVRNQVNKMTKTYQDVRLFATNVQDYTSVIWGAVGNCILPVLYGLLGACAAVLRAFTQQLEARTFAPTYATPAPFIIAAIGGGVVGLFNNFSIGQGISLPPLAAAFLVGYAADIFFSFLEGSMQNLGKAKPR